MAFESIPSILSPQQILDSAFGRASKIQAADKDRGHRFRKTLIDQLESVRDTIDATLGRYVEKFPSVDQINPYHRALIDLLIGIDAYKIALAAIHRGRLNSIALLNRTLKAIQRQTDVGVLSVEKRRAWGRISSLVNELERPLSQLADFRATLRRLPSVVPGQATAVIAGYPNVGKSSLIRALTNAEPEVANYPFTTKSANVGHFELHRKGPGVRYHESYVTFQLIDTPGLLDRPAAERNFIEQQATLALQHLADAVIFLRDPTGHCGYPVEVQEHLLAEVRELVPAAPLLVIETKIDVESGSRVDTRAMGLAPADMSVSTVTREGIPELIERLVTIFTSRPKDPELAAFLAGDPALEA